MQENNINNKRIAKNTIILYFRMLLTMAVSLYTSRVVLSALGVEDFSIYNVVGGIVTMMTFLNSSLNITTQRFMNYEMGKGRFENLNKIFSMSFWSYTIIAIVVLVVCESIGLWFFY
jgi:Na+-driven multidrug efflux pump